MSNSKSENCKVPASSLFYFASAILVSVACAPLVALADESTRDQPPSPAALMDGNNLSTSYFGALLGANIPTGNQGTDNSTGFGLTVGTKANTYVGLGFYGTYYGQGNRGTVFGLPVGTATNTYNLTGEINGFFSIFHAGADLGVGINTWSGYAGSAAEGDSRVAMIYGPEAGVDVPLGQAVRHLSIGGEIHYLFTSAAQSQGNLQALAAFKVWL